MTSITTTAMAGVFEPEDSRKEALRRSARQLFDMLRMLGRLAPVTTRAQAHQALVAGYERCAHMHEQRGNLAARDRDLACARALREAMPGPHAA